MKSVAAIIAVTLLTGCAGFHQPINNTDYGERPEKPLVTAHKYYFETYLRDPESARYSLTECYKAYMNDGLIYGGKVIWTGWACTIGVNARNGFGGYTGSVPYVVMFNRPEGVFMAYKGFSPLFTRVHD